MREEENARRDTRSSSGRLDGNGNRKLVRLSLPRAQDGERRSVRHGEADGRASHASVRYVGGGFEFLEPREGRRSHQRPGTIHRRTNHRSLPRGGASHWHARSRRRPSPHPGDPSIERTGAGAWFAFFRTCECRGFCPGSSRRRDACGGKGHGVLRCTRRILQHPGGSFRQSRLRGAVCGREWKAPMARHTSSHCHKSRRSGASWSGLTELWKRPRNPWNSCGRTCGRVFSSRETAARSIDCRVTPLANICAGIPAPGSPAREFDACIAPGEGRQPNLHSLVERCRRLK